MIEQKQPDALRLAEVIEDYVECTEFDSEQAATELRRQHAEIEALRAKLDQATVALKDISNDNWPDAGINAGEYANLVLYELAAGARPVEPVQKLRPDFIAGYDAGMADAKRIQAAQPAPAERTGCKLGCTTECKAKAHGCASECPALPWQPQPAPAAVDGPDDGHVVQQFRRRDCTDWHDGHADHTDGGGPYEERTLYTTPQPAPRQEAQQSSLAHMASPEGWDADDASKPRSRSDLGRVLAERSEATGALPSNSGWFHARASKGECSI